MDEPEQKTDKPWLSERTAKRIENAEALVDDELIVEGDANNGDT